MTDRKSYVFYQTTWSVMTLKVTVPSASLSHK